MLRKLIVLAISTGLAAKLYRNYVDRQEKKAASAVAPARRRRRAGVPANPA